jgi:hypothetical protein
MSEPQNGEYGAVYVLPTFGDATYFFGHHGQRNLSPNDSGEPSLILQDSLVLIGGPLVGSGDKMKDQNTEGSIAETPETGALRILKDVLGLEVNANRLSTEIGVSAYDVIAGERQMLFVLPITRNELIHIAQRSKEMSDNSNLLDWREFKYTGVVGVTDRNIYRYFDEEIIGTEIGTNDGQFLRLSMSTQILVAEAMEKGLIENKC